MTPGEINQKRKRSALHIFTSNVARMVKGVRMEAADEPYNMDKLYKRVQIPYGYVGVMV